MHNDSILTNMKTLTKPVSIKYLLSENTRLKNQVLNYEKELQIMGKRWESLVRSYQEKLIEANDELIYLKTGIPPKQKRILKVTFLKG